MTETEIRARPTLYKGIQMRSRLEADYAATLDRDSCSWKYEPACFASESAQWLPDFSIAHHGTHTYVELKPAYLLKRKDGESVNEYTDRIDAVLTRMTVAWQSEPEACLELVFWTYGASAPDFTLFGFTAFPWMAFAAGPPGIPLLWPGMQEHVKSGRMESGANGEIARRWRGLTGKMASHTWPGALSNGVLAVYADSVEWAEKVRHAGNRLVLVLNLIPGGEPVRKVNVQLDAVS